MDRELYDSFDVDAEIQEDWVEFVFSCTNRWSVFASQIMKSLDELSAAEINTWWTQVLAAATGEIQSFIELRTFTRAPHALHSNILSSRWLYKWKQKPGEERKIKARLVIRGYEDNDAQTLATWANTATRWGQRIVCSVSAQNQWTMLSADVGTAFLRGLTFPELAAIPANQRELSALTLLLSTATWLPSSLDSRT